MNNDSMKQEWVDKYQPLTLDDYVLDLDLKQYFKDMIANNALLNSTFLGVAGSGKTTLAKILCKELNAVTLFVKCATDGTIDTLRSKVEPFCNSMSFDNRPKVVILDELDSATQQSGSGSSFQMGLRTLIEAAQDDTRFIATANYNKIIPAVLSRCPVIPLKFSQKDLLLHLKKILDAEKISYTKDSLKAFIEEAFRFYPDCRKIIKHLQFCCNTGSLVVKMNAICNSEKDIAIEAIVKSTIESANLLDVRKMYLQSKTKINDYIEFGQKLFDYAVDHDLISDDGVLKLSDQTFYLSQVVDKESIFFGMLTTVRKYLK